MKSLRFILIGLIIGMAGCHSMPSKQSNSASVDQKDTAQATTLLPFRASGTEPFWSIKIIPGKSIVYASADDSPVTFAYKSPKTMKEEKVYTVGNENYSLTLKVLKKTCQNGMSGRYSTHTVLVDLQNLETQKEQTLQGCGKYLQAEEDTDK